MTEFLQDMLILNNHIASHQDPTCTEWIRKFNTKYYGELVSLTRPPRRSRRMTYEELKDQIIKSYNENANLNVDIDTSTKEKCVESLQGLENTIAVNKKRTVLCVERQGFIIKFLKSEAPKDCQLGFYLSSNGVMFSDSHCRNLVLLHELIEKHSKLKNCSLNLSTLIQKRKQIEKICVELGW